MSVLDLFFPKRCVGCGKIGRYFCTKCRQGIRLIAHDECICPVCGRHAIDGFTHPACQKAHSPDRLISFFHYDGIVRTAVRSLKYRSVSDIGAEFVACIPNGCLEDVIGKKRIAVIPVPLHRGRQMGRGFNQAELLGGYIALRLRVPMCSDMLRRTTATRPQVSMKSKKERFDNMKNVFELEQTYRKSLSGSAWLLFDDVFTTGSTVRSAAAVLRSGGAKEVWVMTMAR